MSVYEAVLAALVFLLVFGISRLSYEMGYRNGLRRGVDALERVDAAAAALEKETDT